MGGHAISFQIKPWVAFRLPHLLIELFYISMPVVRTDSRSSVGVRSRDYQFSRMGNLPHFLTNAAPLGALGARELRCQRRAFPCSSICPVIFCACNLSAISWVFLTCVGVTKRQWTYSWHRKMKSLIDSSFTAWRGIRHFTSMGILRLQPQNHLVWGFICY